MILMRQPSRQLKETLNTTISRPARSLRTMQMLGTSYHFNSFILSSIFMWQHRESDKRFSVVDIDPYGGADPFLDAAVQAVDDGGTFVLLCNCNEVIPLVVSTSN